MYTIHTLVYNAETLDLSIVVPGVTTGVDVFGLIVPGGGEICADLDVAGAPIDVEEFVCVADAGTMSADMMTVCLDGETMISATANGDAIVPEGYSNIYVLTMGEDLVIMNAGPDPMFNVTEGGMYTIHSLVYDPNTLDLGIVEIGVTTGVDVFGLIIPGGGDICASLDVAGAMTYVEAPMAGTLTADESIVALDGPTTISATPNGDSNVPDGYSTIYVLTMGESLTIVNAGGAPEFSVDEAGMYTIHTLVYDETTLNLGIVELGVTTGVDVYGLIVPGGGEICADLDVFGAPIIVEDEGCTADAGSLYSEDPFNCKVDGIATVTAQAYDSPVIPEGYEQIFVLTNAFSLTILDVNTEAVFEVSTSGFYRVHSLVYDPTTLDLGIVEIGTTTGFDVFSLLIDGGGDICASLDVNGALNLVLPSFFCGWFSTSPNLQKDNGATSINDLFNQYDDYASFEKDMISQMTKYEVFPNPVSDNLNIMVDLLEDEQMTYQLLDASGRVLESYQINENSIGRMEMDMSSYPTGMYYLQFQSDYRTFIEKVQVMR